MIKKLRLLLSLIIYRLHIVGKDAVLLDTPEHDNLGDQAIAVAEVKFLQDNGIRFWEVPANKLEGYEKWYAKFTPAKKKILIHGGGFLGSLWAVEEYRFRRIIQSFKNHAIIVFPQTISFGDKDAFFEESQRIYNGHDGLTIFAREERSYRLLKNCFPNVNTYLIPDMVLYLSPPINECERKNILFCMRNDKEKTVAPETIENVKNLINIRLGDVIEYTDTESGRAVDKKSRENEVTKKLSEFAHAKLVVTDRLHGMIFSAISGTPCIAFQNISGKVGGVYKWIKELEYIYFAESFEDFERKLSLLNMDRTFEYSNEKYYEEYKKIKEVICQ